METMISSTLAPSLSFSPSIERVVAPHFSMTTAGFIIPTLTGILSACCSILILYAIYKSPVKLSSTYHRIMAIMSIFDLLASVCIALTTLPMPSDDILRFAGPMLGNHLTCQIQGYIITFGLAGGGSLYMCLSWYFVCRMILMMDSYTITKRLEPVFYLYSFGVAIFLPSYNLSKDLINTVPSDQFCGIGINHSNCNYTLEKEFYECDHQVNDTTYPEFETSLNIVMYLVGFNVVMIVVAMIIIIWAISKKNKNIKCALEEQRIFASENTTNEDEINLSELRYARVLIVQALMYIFAFLITWIFMVIPMAVYLDRDDLNVLQVFKALFFPMQGFWNLMIFAYDKAYLAYTDDEYQSYWTIIRIVLFHPSKAPDVFLPESLRLEVKNSKAEEIHSTLNNQNNHESLNEDPVAPSKSSERDMSSSRFRDSIVSSNSSCVIHRDGVDFIGEENRRFYLDSNGLKRTGKMEDRRKGRTAFYASASIESPGGFVGDSIGSNLSQDLNI